MATPNSNNRMTGMPMRPAILQVFTLVLLLSVQGFHPAASSPPQRYRSKPAPAVNQALVHAIDSLNAVVASRDSTNRLLTRSVMTRDSALREQQDQAVRQAARVSALEKQLESYKGENRKLDQSNRILILFNSVVGLLLLITLVWFLRNIGRKKTGKTNASPAQPRPGQAGSGTAGFQLLEQKLEQLERLSKLKEQGALNEDEFQRHKQQVIGNSG